MMLTYNTKICCELQTFVTIPHSTRKLEEKGFTLPTNSATFVLANCFFFLVFLPEMLSLFLMRHEASLIPCHVLANLTHPRRFHLFPRDGQAIRYAIHAFCILVMRLALICYYCPAPTTRMLPLLLAAFLALDFDFIRFFFGPHPDHVLS